MSSRMFCFKYWNVQILCRLIFIPWLNPHCLLVSLLIKFKKCLKFFKSIITKCCWIFWSSALNKYCHFYHPILAWKGLIQKNCSQGPIAFHDLYGVFYPAVSVNRGVSVTLHTALDPPSDSDDTWKCRNTITTQALVHCEVNEWWTNVSPAYKPRQHLLVW